MLSVVSVLSTVTYRKYIGLGVHLDLWGMLRQSRCFPCFFSEKIPERTQALRIVYILPALQVVKMALGGSQPHHLSAAPNLSTTDQLLSLPTLSEFIVSDPEARSL